MTSTHSQLQRSAAGRESEQPTYIFLDESGNLDFSSRGTRYFVLTSISISRPFPAYAALDEYRYDCLEGGTDLEFFHCANDRKTLRANVFGRIADSLDGIRIDSLIVEKPKTAPALQAAPRFYPRMLGYLLQWVAGQELKLAATELIVITDTLPVQSQRKAVTKGIQSALGEAVPSGMRYRILHHAARSHYGLQIADYCSWAMFRKWERSDPAHYGQIRSAIRREFELFARGTRFYYSHAANPQTK